MTSNRPRQGDLEWWTIYKRTAWQSLQSEWSVPERVFAVLTIELAAVWMLTTGAWLAGMVHGDTLPFPYNNLLSCFLLIDVCVMLNGRRSIDLALSAFALAWLTASLDVLRSYFRGFDVIGSPESQPEWQNFVWSVRFGFAAPALFSIPAVYFISREFDQILHSSRRWLLLAPIIAVVDVLVLLVWLLVLFLR